jgi:hypothetical protein
MTMSKSNDVSTLYHRPLADSELDAMSGGIARSMPNGRTDVIIVCSQIASWILLKLRYPT